ncbi:lipocalin-like domain-containing protein [Galbibacter pacificus]|uniref:Lipocalin-like domain-containing protein n=1 Tax=Galbibacter pacificus TaxID=2996052 RepID=A0ABT6FMJ8_9FLAO|nr:lipocalin-like domain-containing protein [Galbibacter pacificus]MDG3581009.1 lipocalin-like domain-containing protein [Galbibacter pacificus]MDG3584487.1 lipocalin-like domain-containing protein [Galbibacter pacificus]
MQKLTFLIAVAIISISCSPKKNQPKTVDNPLIGTWRLISGTTIEGSDTTVTDYTRDREMIKIINKTHFAFLNHDLNHGKDSTAAFVAGGGTYSVKDSLYTEHLTYCNFREWEGNSFSFVYTVHGDTLVTKGIERIEDIGVNRINIEKLVREK